MILCSMCLRLTCLESNNFKIMYKLLWSLVLFIWYAQASVINSRAESKTPWSLADIFVNTSTLISSFNGTWISDVEFYFTSPDRSIRKYNAESNEFNILVTSKLLENYGKDSYFKLSPDQSKILVRYGLKEIFRHSYSASYDIVALSTNSIRKIHNGEKLQDCIWSPLNDRLSYVYDNNVYIHFEDDRVIRLTEDGVEGVVYNGVPDWVYEEEVLGSGNAMWWSKDGQSLAVANFNDTNVKTFKYHLYGEAANLDDQYSQEIDLKYPKSGSTNPTVHLRIFNLFDSYTAITITAPTEIVSADHILQNVVWASNSQLLITWLNRRQNVASIQLCNLEGKCNEVKSIEEPNGWIMMSTPICFSTGKNCLLTHWINNWYQIWNLDLTTGQNIWESRGNFTVLQIYGYDEINQKVYYLATMEGDPSVSHVFANKKCLSCALKDVDGVACTYATASFSTEFSFCAITCSGPTPKYTNIVRTKDGLVVKKWIINEGMRYFLSQKLNPRKHYLNVTLADKSIGYAQVFLPPNFDSKKKYPMIIEVYGGPNSVRVSSSFALAVNLYMTTTREVIYATIDGRGTGNKGREFLFTVNNDLGFKEVEDQIFVTSFLQTLPYVDRERTGIWGWSYGGYMTARTLSKDTENVFKCGISVAPVTSWLYYDSIYTERYMGLPTPEDNWAKYLESSVLDNVTNFRTHDFMLIHGSGDDNVHYQNSLLLAKVLQKNDILFEQMTYTDETHSIANFKLHLYHSMDQFWLKCLKLTT